MMDPDFDPYEDLENCKIAIHELGNAIEQLVKANNLQAKMIKRNQTSIDTMQTRIDALQTQLNAAQ